MGELDDGAIEEQADEEQAIEEQANDEIVASVYIDEFEAFLLEKRKMLACRSCGYYELGAIGFSETDKCSVMSIEYSALNVQEGTWDNEGHGQPVYVAECGNCGCMSIYNARTVVKWLKERKEREKRWET